MLTESKLIERIGRSKFALQLAEQQGDKQTESRERKKLAKYKQELAKVRTPLLPGL